MNARLGDELGGGGRSRGRRGRLLLAVSGLPSVALLHATDAIVDGLGREAVADPEMGVM